MADSNKGGGLLGKLLLPGYTDAGPDSSFKPIRIAAGGGGNDSMQDDNDDDDDDAATEIHDNRTSTHRSTPKIRPPQTQSRQPHVAPRPSPLPSPRPNYSGGENYGFFPNTKPAPSPRPTSPPALDRSHVSTSSVVPEIGAATRQELENQQPYLSWKNEGKESLNEGGDSHIMALSEKALQEMDEKQGTINSNDTPRGFNRQSSLVENDDASYVSSTGSEMGTVINVGSDRFAEIEAMAAMVERNPEFLEVHQEGDEEEEEFVDHQRDGKVGLSLPILEARSFDQPTISSQFKSTPQRTITGSLELGLHMKTTTGETNDTITTTPSINHQQFSNNPSKSAMMSAAIRRIGSGLTSKTLSAPPTPKTPGVPVPKVEDLLKSTLTPGRKQQKEEGSRGTGAPLSFLLRSPGSFARRSVEKEKTVLTPRFSRTPSRSDDNAATNKQPKAPVSPSLLLPGFKLATKCFSFDNTADKLTLPVAEDDILRGLPGRRSRNELERYNLRYRPVKESQSWDVGHVEQHSGAFRSRTNAYGGFRQTASHDDHSQLRERLNSDNFSPRKYSNAPALELKIAQRIEIEREDALDILACLVERGCDQPQPQNQQQTKASDSFIVGVKEEIGKLKAESNDADDNYPIRLAILEELLASHAYALEMKRATLSASTWLKSIGRQELSKPTEEGGGEIGDSEQAAGELDRSEGDTRISDDALNMEVVTLKAMLHSAQMELKEKSETNQKLDVELSKCRAEIGRLKSASRSEPLHLTANRSMLDLTGEDSPTTPSPQKNTREASSSIQKENDEKDGQDKVFLDDSFHPDNSIFPTEEDEAKDRLDKLDAVAMKAALEQANVTIRRLYGELNKKKVDSDKDEAIQRIESETQKESNTSSSESSLSPERQTINVRMLDGENFVTDWTDLTPPLPPPPDHGLRSPIVNAVLEQWTKDRGLHESLLIWIERAMIDNDLESSVPPLTISSLDHQVRDGFVMHVLPMLLRRADILVDVQTRANRRTSYDMTVTVSQKSPSVNADVQFQKPTKALLDQQHQIDEWAENFEPNLDSKSVAHSAVTEHIANSNQYYTGSYNEGNPVHEYSSFAGMTPHIEGVEIDASMEQQPGIMSTLGGALGGLLNRRKYTTRGGDSIPPSPIRHANSIGEEDEPYHRVVSAPPGRIGVTFVDFRGHAMVSDVAPDSPLSSWVYPSDILIAIDEVPVSGMRVRDIVKVLTSRRDNQRALRMISSHAMNEFTLNASALAEPT